MLDMVFNHIFRWCERVILRWYNSPYAILSILLFALILRLSGLLHGLGTHPDERHMVMVMEHHCWDDMNPHSFAYGSLPFYVTWGVAQLTALFIPSASHYDGLFIVGRCCAIFLALCAIVKVYPICMIS